MAVFFRSLFFRLRIRRDARPPPMFEEIAVYFGLTIESYKIIILPCIYPDFEEEGDSHVSEGIPFHC